MTNIWNGRFKDELKNEVLDYTTGDDIKLDYKLVVYDIIGTEAHDIMLYKVGILKKSSIINILNGLERIKQLYLDGKFVLEKKYEDVHMNIERAVINYIGEEDGGNIHIARSRNDQIQLDLRLYMRDEILAVQEVILNLISVLLEQAKSNIDTIMVGYTHFQHAQPITYAHWCLAQVDAFMRDYKRLTQFFEMINQSPLGAAAMAGTSWNIDRKIVAELLGFNSVQENTLDCISNRGEFITELVSIISIAMTHLSKIAEDLILWSTYEYGMVEIHDSYATGSSIMPQKKNPDVCELIRARTGVINGLLVHVLSVLKGLPSGYNRDHQETKYPMFKSIDIIKNSFNIMTGLIGTLKLNKERMKELAGSNYVFANEIMDYLVKNGIPLRTAHKIVGKFIKEMIKDTTYSINKIQVERLTDLLKNELGIELKITQAELDQMIDITNIVNKRTLIGGPAPNEVFRMLNNRSEEVIKHKDLLLHTKKNYNDVKNKLNNIINSIINGDDV